MPNKKQSNEIEHINKEINSLQDLIKKNEKRTKDKSFSNQKNTNYSE